MTTHYRDFCGATASITEHTDGTATLKICAGIARVKKKYKSKKGAPAAWRRWCA